MTSTETAKGPSLFKAALVFAATAAMLAISSRAPAQELSVTPHAHAGPVSVRIRGANAEGLNAVAFADWLTVHRTARRARSAELFLRADVNRDGRVTAVELKNLLIGLAKA
jgi:hypothetical protein